MDSVNKHLTDYIFCSFGGYRDECRVFLEQLQEETVDLLVFDYILYSANIFSKLIQFVLCNTVF